MKVRTDILRMYKEIHGWVGIVSGLALFIAFFAGAVTMFEEPIQRWASAPTSISAPVPLERAPELVEAVLAAHPEAARSYDVHLETGPENPARVTWPQGSRRDPQVFLAALAPDGTLEVEKQAASPVAQFIDRLHQQVGLPFAHEVAMPIMGAISLLYFIALVSGVIVLLPSLVSDFFAVRVGKNAKRMWLDVHNVLGIVSLPFHIVMALTAVVFAFHDEFYDLQGAAFMDRGAPRAQMAPPPPPNPNGQGPDLLTPAELVQRVESQAPGFTIRAITYHTGREGQPQARLSGHDPRFGLRGPTFGMVEADPVTGALTDTTYMPGLQDAWGAAITSFFALHFGSFGGAPIRWSYFLLGLAGAMLFYTGNLLWVESRRKRERKAGAVTQTRATRALGALTVGVPLGCVAGIAVTLAAAKPLGTEATAGIHSAIYYVVFTGFVAWALVRGAARGARELLPAAALALLTIPLASLAFLDLHPWSQPLVDAVSVALAASLTLAARATHRRARNGPRDSVWSHQRRKTRTDPPPPEAGHAAAPERSSAI
ncbi:PepSY-associated TM helix domain-containing protein [Novosphingobium sp. MBES04]|uniref:PepSY-associated TM helix domain-containing protein n=1 Tax=Novosphingobium sp. MBES04 TaxID=1206458 RepID=UPI000A03773D|nr:PepSY-associated TM helix domain-containing protein [Novosphingobium sp. MBES04]